MYKKKFFVSRQENATPYYTLLSILKFDKIFKLKNGIFAYKIVNNKSNIPAIFSQTIHLASTCHSYDTRLADKQNVSRPKV